MKLSGDRDSSMFTCWPTAPHSARRSHYRCHYHSLLCVFKWVVRGGGSLSSHFKARYSVLSSLLSSNSCWPGYRVGASILRRCTTPPPTDPNNTMTTTPRNRRCYYPENYSSYCKECDRPRLTVFKGSGSVGRDWGSDKPCGHQIRWLRWSCWSLINLSYA